MDREAISKTVGEILVDFLGVEEKQVTDGASLIDDLGADSLDEIELVMEAEERFDVEFEDDEVGTILTVGDAISMIERKLSEKAAA